MESKTEPRTSIKTLEISILEMRIEVVSVNNNKEGKSMDKKCKRIKDIHEMNEGKYFYKGGQNLSLLQAVRQIEFKCQAKDRLLVCPN